METLSSLKSKLMMLSSAWEVCPSCSMMDPVLTPTPVSPSEDTPFLNFANWLKKLQEDQSPSLKLCSSSWPLEDIPLSNNAIIFPMNGRKEVTSAKEIFTSSQTCPNTSILWPCSQWLSLTSKPTAPSLQPTKKVPTKTNSGSTTMRTPWTSSPSYLTSALLYIVINIMVEILSSLMTLSIGLVTSHTCWVLMIPTWWTASEDTFPSTLIMKEATSQLIPTCSSAQLLLILTSPTQLPWTVLLDLFMVLPIRNVSSGWLLSRTTTKEKSPTLRLSNNSSERLLVKAESSQDMAMLFSETLIPDSCIWKLLLTRTSRTIIFATSPGLVSIPFLVFSEPSARSKTLIPMLTHSVELFSSTTVLLWLFRYDWERFLHCCVWCFKSLGLSVQRYLGQNIWSSYRTSQQHRHCQARGDGHKMILFSLWILTYNYTKASIATIRSCYLIGYSDLSIYH